MIEINLKKHDLKLGDCLEQLRLIPDNSVDSIVTDPPYGLSFMGKAWDYDVPSVEIWAECLRVLKPGGHILAFFGTRTYHRGVVKIEDAGFEIRDQIQWLYGSGFPKSMDISKAIDKQAGHERNLADHTRKDTGFRFQAGGTESLPPVTEAAKQWQGWGTALKPANEPIVLARKPLSEKTVASNVLKYGTGGINVDGCRVEGIFESGWSKSGSKESENTSMSGKNYERPPKPDNPQGRWPANLILDEEAAEVLDEQSGTLKSGGGDKGNKKVGSQGYGSNSNTFSAEYNPDSGGASRFFYVAKASKSERSRGLDHLPDAILARSCQAIAEAERGNAVEAGAGAYNKARITKNNHPTVKPLKLMTYLVRLITPSQGIVLDPFMGSGSTGVAAVKEGFGFIGIERDDKYFEIAKARIEAAE